MLGPSRMELARQVSELASAIQGMSAGCLALIDMNEALTRRINALESRQFAVEATNNVVIKAAMANIHDTEKLQ